VSSSSPLRSPLDSGNTATARDRFNCIDGFGLVFARALRFQKPRLEGNDVAKLQEALLKNKLTPVGIKVTGIFDMATERAVKQFQQATKQLSSYTIVLIARLSSRYSSLTPYPAV
jgi:hypothetical protein